MTQREGQATLGGNRVESGTQGVGQGRWLTVAQVAEELRIPRTRAYELIGRGELPAVRLGTRSIRVHREQLERFLLEDRPVFAH